MFIVVEGIDGCGKTSTLGFIKDYLTSKTGREVILTREPGGTVLGERLREIALSPDGRMCLNAQAYLMMASRSQLLDEVIKPALAAGKSVVADRYFYSTLVYQAGADLSVLEAASYVPQPDLVLLFNIDHAVAEARANWRGEADDRFNAVWADDTYTKRYLALAAKYKNIKVVDANQSKDSVKEQVLAHLDAAYNL